MRETFEFFRLLPDHIEIADDCLHQPPARATALAVFERREIGRRDMERRGHFLQRQAARGAQIPELLSEGCHLFFLSQT